MKNFLQSYILNPKWIFRYLLILFILSLIPILLISQYNHPCADDYSYGIHTINTWRETGSISKTLSSAVDGTKYVYQTWQGSFIGVFFMTLHPAIFNESLYSLVPIILLAGFILSTMLLLKVIFIDYLKSDKYCFGIIAIVITFISIQFSFAPVEAFYWYNGSMYYTGFYSLTLLLFSIMLLYIKSEKKRTNIIYTILAPILAFLIGGGNFVVALFAFVIVLLIVIYCAVFRRKKLIAPILALIFIGISLIISITAPGNAARQSLMTGMNPISAIFTSFYYVLTFLFQFVPLTVYIAIAALSPLIYSLMKKSDFKFPMPGIVTILLYGAYASSFTPNLYAMSGLGPLRVININLNLAILFLILLIAYWCGWYAKIMENFTKKNKTGNTKTNNTKSKQTTNPTTISRKTIVSASTVAVFIALFIVSSAVYSSSFPDMLLSISTSRSLISGEAKSYHEQYLSRLTIYTDQASNDIVVPPYTVRPYVLYFDDITIDPADWRNVALADYYGKNSAVLAG